MNWRGWGISPGDLQSVSLTVSYHKEQQYIWFEGRVLYVNWRQWVTPSVTLYVSYHKEQQYIWFRSGDLNGF